MVWSEVRLGPNGQMWWMSPKNNTFLRQCPAETRFALFCSSYTSLAMRWMDRQYSQSPFIIYRQSSVQGYRTVLTLRNWALVLKNPVFVQKLNGFNSILRVDKINNEHSLFLLDLYALIRQVFVHTLIQSSVQTIGMVSDMEQICLFIH